jgi:beta-galactosidase
VDVLILPWKILYDPGLEIALIEFVRNGGRLITTTDLFKKNEDNVYLTYLPQIYSELLGWMDKNFVNEENYTETKIITEKQTGKGRAWMIKNHLELKEWKEFIKNTLP